MKAAPMKRLLPAIALLAALSACSTTGLSDADTLALYRANAGAPVRDMQYFGSFNGWTPLGNSALAVWTRPGEAFLLELDGPCVDLDFAPAISMSNMMGRVSARFDSVYVHGSGMDSARIPCRIQTIKPLDISTLRQSEKALREAKVVERETPAR